MRTALWSIQLNISRTRHWHNDNDTTPRLDFIPALQRRRLSALARINLELAHQINPENTPIRCIFASRHGEIQQTVEMLKTLAHGELISPAMFSHSVHNAAQGLWSILAQQKDECSAISAGLDTLPLAFVEVAGMLCDAPEPQVLLMYSDEAVPEVLSPDDLETKQRFALSCMIDTGTANLQLSAIAKSSDHPSNPRHDFFSWWQSSQSQLITTGNDCDWEWTKL
ncbi:beta-ketoacyl synthase chain length factor [Chitinibacter fontanus]|uniref:Beta-ketoacyl synthase chain length factor n=1 Tax=Chitinibacter fontanus TaxID=1737446 RepID=A0A7D5ZL87_9NEIS|nr:beta-ketoacyl synthase chain length factor [Chitinibacter fontanus]QLI82310.1 beta-ketoacyl synthase chain length factor [Chitinibacter fontanus]